MQLTYCSPQNIIPVFQHAGYQPLPVVLTLSQTSDKGRTVPPKITSPLMSEMLNKKYTNILNCIGFSEVFRHQNTAQL